MGSCCRHGLVPDEYKSQYCSKCKFDMFELYKKSAIESSSSVAATTLLIKLECPKCKTRNGYRITIERRRG